MPKEKPQTSQRKGQGSLYRENRIYGYILIIPAVLIYGFFVFIPIFQSILLSFQSWDGFSPQRSFVGLENYLTVIASTRFWAAFLNNIIWSALSIIPIALGLVLAVVIFQSKVFGSTFFRVSFLFPFVLSRIISGIIWGWIYHPDWGTINTILRGIGLGKLAIAWTAEPGTALVAANLVGGWTWYGFCMVIFLAGLQSIDENVYDAARIDGASSVQIFFKITIPLLKPFIRMLSIITIIFSFKVFDLVFILTRGGPFQSSEVLGLVIYIQGFNLYKLGSSSATAILLTIIVFIISIFSIREKED